MIITMQQEIALPVHVHSHPAFFRILVFIIFVTLTLVGLLCFDLLSSSDHRRFFPEDLTNLTNTGNLGLLRCKVTRTKLKGGCNQASITKEYPYPLKIVKEDYDVATKFKVQGGGRFSEYLEGGTPYYYSEETLYKSDVVARSRRYHVKKSMQFAWNSYVKYAFGMDELLPLTGNPSNNWGGYGVTLVDSLDTLWLMNMTDEFWQARDWVRDQLDYSTIGYVKVFETVIRDLGGLLSAYDWSGDRTFLEKATDLGERLLHAFDQAHTGIPFGYVSLKDGKASNKQGRENSTILAEFGSIQIEFRYLARVTERYEFAEKVEHIFEVMHNIAPSNGLYTYCYENTLREGSEPIPSNDVITFGGKADSFYEYMLKVWFQGGKTEPLYREMYDQSIDGMHAELLQKSTPSGLTYIAKKSNGKLDRKMGHLVCFMGGVLALGAYTDLDGITSKRAKRDLKTAKALTYTCYQMYARMRTGISAESVEFDTIDQDFQIEPGESQYLLRPEAVESFFVLHQLTGDPIYREWGWEVFQAIEKRCRTEYAYGSFSNVDDADFGYPLNKMESFFLAETLKYLYLLFDPDTKVDIIHRHVFNTEAHPTRIFPLLK